MKLKAEQEALECQRQLEETRSKTAQVIHFVVGIDSVNLKFVFRNFTVELLKYIRIKKKGWIVNILVLYIS